MYRRDLLAQAEPIKGAREGLQALKDMGFRQVPFGSDQASK